MSKTTDINQKFTISGTTVTLSKSKTSGKIIYDIESDTFIALNDFNTKYANYLRCTPNLGLRKNEQGNGAVSAVMDSSTYYTNKQGCSTNIPTINEVTTAKNTLETQITIYENALSLFDASNMLGNKKVNNKIKTYAENLLYIKNTHADIIKKRNEYDAKLEKLKVSDKDVKSSLWDLSIQKENEIVSPLSN